MTDSRCVDVEIAVDGDQQAPLKRVPLGLRTTIGRDDDNDLSFPDSMLSRRHAEFQVREGAFYIVDLDSTNGTYVNDLRVQGERLLDDGDVVTVGGTSLVFHETPLRSEREGRSGEEKRKGELILDPGLYTTQRITERRGAIAADGGLGVICQASTLPELFDKILEAILDLIPAQRAAIIMMEGQPPTLTTKATRTRRGAAEMGDVRLDIIEKALKARQALLVRDLSETSPSAAGSAEDAPKRSVMCTPLWSTLDREGNFPVWGLIYLDSISSRPRLSDRNLDVLVMLANIASTKIENARLQEVSLQKQRMEDDIRRAAEIQSDLLPRSSPSIEGYQVCGATDPCRMVGGDYFDFEYDGMNLYLALADVSGKGTGAAMLMVALRTAVRSHWLCSDLTQATARINQTFHRNVPPDKYATFFLARLDTLSGKLTYVNAGHNRPLLVQPSGRWRRLEVGGTVLGAFPDMMYEQESVVLDPGSCLLVFSDGISDAWPDSLEADRHLVNLVRARRAGEVAALRAEILNAAKRTNDDRTLIVLERLPEEYRRPS
jgi:phosphoserine phosphatase RsbU/P